MFSVIKLDMPHLLIGGSARCGKSTLAESIRQSTSIPTLLGDAYRASIRENTPYEPSSALHTPSAEKSGEGYSFIIDHILNTSSEIEKKRRQGRFMWGFLESYLRAYENDSGKTALAESIDIWPDQVKESVKNGFNCRAVFLVDTSRKQADRLIASRDTEPRNWMNQNGYTDMQIYAWAHFNIARSRLIQTLARSAGYLCLDLAEVSFTNAQDTAKEYLLAK